MSFAPVLARSMPALATLVAWPATVQATSATLTFDTSLQATRPVTKLTSVLPDNYLYIKAGLCHAPLAEGAMARPISVLEVTPEEKRELERRVAAPTTPGRDGMRAHIVLLRSEGIRQQEVASRLGVSAPSVTKWSQRFDREGLDGLKDKPGRGAKPSIPLATVRRVVEEAGKAPPGRQRWSTRSLAREVGISAHSVARIWQNQGLKPHRLRTFKVSRDKKFEEKFWDVVGLYLDPPERSLVLCCDEKTQCQALERTQPGLPLGRGHIRTQTHDYIRHGTVTLFAALSYLEGKLIYRTEQQHTHVEWLRFLKQIDRETPEDVDLHLIADNYCTHKHGKVVSWLKKHQRFQMHFIPTSSSWMNMVERFFADLTQDCVRAGSFTSVAELVEAITAYLACRNENPKPYQWKAEGAKTLAKIQRARETLESLPI